MTARQLLPAIWIVLASLGVGVPRAEVPVPDNYGDAMRWYRDAAEAGDPKAMFYLGLTLERGLQGAAEPEEAVRWYRRSAEKGYALAQFKLGLLHQFGQVVDLDTDAARDWYEKAAAQDLPDAQYNLAVLLELDEGGPAIIDRAIALYKKAARHGIAEAYQNLGGVYARGEQVEQDLVEAMKWLLLAEEAGLTQVATLKATISRSLNDVELRDARARADRWTAGQAN